jgi:predicted nucleotidyltransferase
MNSKFLDDSRVPDQPYPELRGVLEAYVDEIKAELAGNLVGIYMIGSLATGDFDLDSDIDFLVVTKTGLTEKNTPALQAIQEKIHAMDCYPAKHLEGSFISIGDLNDWNAVGEKKLYYFDNGSTTIEQSDHDNKWHVRWILREHGITLVGQRPKTILQPVPLIELQNEIKATLLLVMKLFADEMDRPLSFFNSRFGQPFTVLTVCRMLHTLHTGTVQSKKAGAEWTKQFVDPKWANLIGQAWIERAGVRFGVKIGQRADPAALNETLEFIKYAVAQSDNIGGPAMDENKPTGR